MKSSSLYELKRITRLFSFSFELITKDEISIEKRQKHLNKKLPHKIQSTTFLMLKLLFLQNRKIIPIFNE